MDLKRTLLLFTAFLIDKGVLSIKPLSCFVGLGNRSARDKQPIIACPEEKRYVCVKMYGGGMGDQIKRYCEKLEPEEYEELLDNEARVAEELIDYDPNCIKTKDRGREVFKCRCSTNKCNSGNSIYPQNRSSIALLLALASIQLYFNISAKPLVKI